MAPPSFLSSPSATTSHLTVTKLTSWEELESLGPAWESLLQEGANPTIFSTPEWLGAWWRAHAARKELWALVFRNSLNEVVGIAPLYRECPAGPLRYGVRKLRFVGDGSFDSDNLDVIARGGSEAACARALLSWLAAEPGWDICELNTIALDSATLRGLVRELEDRRWASMLLETPRSTVFLPETWEAYLRQISKKEKSKINYYANRLKREFEASFVRCSDEASLHDNLETLFELHQKRWTSRGLPGSFASSERRAFYYEMAASFLRRNWLEFWLLKLDGKVVAAQYAFRFGETVYALQEGFDPAFGAHGVGFALRAHIFKTLIGEGVRRYDFLGGDEQSKLRWGAQLGRYVDVRFARSGSLGSMSLKLDELVRKVKAWVKAKLPASTRKFVEHGLRRA